MMLCNRFSVRLKSKAWVPVDIAGGCAEVDPRSVEEVVACRTAERSAVGTDFQVC